jgi:hypothetical protein
MATEHDLIDRLRGALNDMVPRCHCGEIGVWEWSDQDGTEHVCHEHKMEHFYAHGPSLDEAAEQARLVLEETAAWTS